MKIEIDSSIAELIIKALLNATVEYKGHDCGPLWLFLNQLPYRRLYCIVIDIGERYNLAIDISNEATLKVNLQFLISFASFTQWASGPEGQAFLKTLGVMIYEPKPWR